MIVVFEVNFFALAESKLTKIIKHSLRFLLFKLVASKQLLNEKNMNSISQEYIDFMKWFKENYPEMHDKYGRNITVPFKEGGGVAVTQSFQISKAEQDKILEIAHKYYEIKDK
jgi:hypothetical protein